MKRSAYLFRAACACGLLWSVLSCPVIADQTVTGNLTVTGSATVAADTAVGGNLDVEGNDLTVGNNSGNYGVGMFYLPSGTDGTRWRLTRLSAWLWEVDNAGTVTPAMRLDASNNLTLYSGGTAALTLNPAAQSLKLGNATLTANGTGLTTSGAVTVGGVLSAASYTASGGAVTGGTGGLILNAGGNNQSITLTPSGNGNVIINGNLGVGTATPATKVHVAGATRVDDVLSVGGADSGESVMVVSANAPAYGVAYRTPASSGWARGYRFIRGDTGAYLGGFGANGSNHTLNKLWIGVNYDQSWVDVSSNGMSVLPTTTSVSPGTGALLVAGGAGVAGNLNVGGSTSQLGTATIGGTSSVYGGLLTIKGDFSPNNPIVMQNTNATNPRIVAFGPGVGGTNAFGFHDYTRGATIATFANSDGALTLNATTSSTSTSSGALRVAGGAGIAGAVNARNLTTSYGLGALPAGLTNGQNTVYVSGSADASGTSDLRPNSIQATALGSTGMALRVLDIGANAQNTAGNVSMIGVRALTNLTSSGAGSGTAYSASPYVTNTGNMTAWVGYEADNGGFISTGDVIGPMTAFRNGTFGRASATTVTAFHAQDLVKGTGIAAGFRGQVSAAAGKYNLYVDGTAQNYLAGNVTVAGTTPHTIPDGLGTNQSVQLNVSPTSGFAAVATGVADGTNNRRAALFTDHTNGFWGLSATASTGNVPFVIRNNGAEHLRIATNGTVTLGGDLNVGGTFTATNYSVSGGTITGSAATGLNLAAGGSNQNVTITPSGTGTIVLNGKIGIGTTTPSAKLDVTGGHILMTAPAATNQDLFIANAGGRKVEIVTDAEGDGKLMLRDASGTITQVAITAGGSSFVNGGNLGLGTSTPLEKLQVVGTVRADVDNRMGFILREKSGDNFRGGLGLKNNGDAYLELWKDDDTVTRVDANGSSYLMGGNVGLGTAAPAAKLHLFQPTGDELVRLETQAPFVYFKETDQPGVGGRWRLVADGGNLRFDRSTGGEFASYFSDIFITGSGKVGVGTTEPFHKFEVNGGYARIAHTAAPYLDFYQSTAAANLKTTRIGSRDGVMLFESINDAYTAPIERLRIAADGSVGIGTSSPTAKLHVAGTARFDGPVRIEPQGDLLMGDFTQDPNP